MKTLRALLWFCLLLPLIFMAVILVAVGDALLKRAPAAESESLAEESAEVEEFAQEEIEI